MWSNRNCRQSMLAGILYLAANTNNALAFQPMAFVQRCNSNKGTSSQLYHRFEYERSGQSFDWAFNPHGNPQSDNPGGDYHISNPKFLLDAISENCDADEPTEECAESIANYLDAVSAGAVQATPIAGAGIGSYLDSIGSASGSAASSGPAVSSYLSAVGSGQVAAPSAQAITSYLDALGSGQVTPPVSGAGISSYLDSVPAAPAAVATPPPPAAAAPAAVAAPSGPAPTSYLDSISEKCDGTVGPTEECSGAITNYLDAISSGTVQPTRMATAGITSYLDSVATTAAPTGATSSGEAVSSYLDSVATGEVAAPTAQAVTSYLDSMSSGAVAIPASGAAIASYLDALGTGAQRTSGSGMSTYLDSV